MSPEEELRLQALKLAWEAHLNGACESESITETAEYFLQFLLTGKAPVDPADE